jgi:hypothetical protein
MTHPNLALIEQFFEAYSRRDLDGLHKVLASNAKWTALGVHPLAGVKNGFGEVIAFFDAMGAVMGKSSPKVEKLIVSANADYAVECQHVWTDRGDGHDLDHLVCVLWTFKDGKIAEGRHFFSDPQAADRFFNYATSLK